MANIELVIKIPEEVKNRLCFGVTYEKDIQTVCKALDSGAPLPKGHGRLIDADAFERRCMFDSNIEDMQDVIYALRDYNPIIEADKGSEE